MKVRTSFIRPQMRRVCLLRTFFYFLSIVLPCFFALTLFAMPTASATGEEAARAPKTAVSPLRLPASATLIEDQASMQKIRVGYSDSLYEPDSPTLPRRVGYPYNQFQKISDYTGWTYEYHYDTLGNLFEKMRAGEIDIIANIAKTPERETYMHYTNTAEGIVQHYIFTRDDNYALVDLSDLSGKRIGVIANTLLETFLRKYISERAISCEVVPMPTDRQAIAALHRCEIDGIFSSIKSLVDITAAPLRRVGVSLVEWPVYMAVAKDRPDLLEALNHAMLEIDSAEPNYFHMSYIHYISGADIASSVTLLDSARSWLIHHDKLRVGYVPYFIPYTATSETDPTLNGIFADILDYICRRHRLKWEAVAYKSHEEMAHALHSGEVDVTIPELQDPELAEHYSIAHTSTVVEATPRILFRKSPKGPVIRVAVNEADAIQCYLVDQNANRMTAIVYSSYKEKINAVRRGDADMAILHDVYYMYDRVRHPELYAGLQLARFGDTTIPLAFGVAKGNIGLLSLLNRDIATMPSDIIQQSIVQHTRYNRTYSWEDFVGEHLSILLVIVTSIATIFVIVVHFLRLSKEKNAQLSAAIDAANAANVAKTRFLSNMSHDLRTPMNAIIGYTALARKHRSDHDPNELEDDLNCISNAGHHLLSIINDVLDMSRIESGATQVVPVDTSIRDLLAGIRPIMEPLLKEKKQVLSLQTENVVHDVVRIDAQKMRQIIINLVGNSVKFTPEGGTITIAVDEQTLPGGCITGADETSTPGARYVCRVTDTGIGMSPEFVKRVFEPFEQEYTNEQSGQIGTGLGTTITKSFVELMGGTIEVESELGKGTTFTIKLPLAFGDPSLVIGAATALTMCAPPAPASAAASAHANAAGGNASDIQATQTEATQENATDGAKNAKTMPQPGENEKPFHGEKVLVVEDNALNRNLAQIQLMDLGISVTTATNGQEAVDLLATCPDDSYDAVLMDVRMPILNGIDATKAIRQNPRPYLQRLPIIALTANAFQEDIDTCLAAGMNAHLAKPIDTVKLTAVLKEKLAKK